MAVEWLHRAHRFQQVKVFSRSRNACLVSWRGEQPKSERAGTWLPAAVDPFQNGYLSLHLLINTAGGTRENAAGLAGSRPQQLGPSKSWLLAISQGSVVIEYRSVVTANTASMVNWHSCSAVTRRALSAALQP